MKFGWLNKIIKKVAEEVHKSKIDELEKRIVDMEKKHEFFLKTISDNERNISKLHDKMYNADLTIAKFDGALSVLVDKAKNKQSFLIDRRIENE